MYCDPRLRMDPVRPEDVAVALLQQDPTSSFDCLAYAEDVGVDPREKAWLDAALCCKAAAVHRVKVSELACWLQVWKSLGPAHGDAGTRVHKKLARHLWDFFFLWFGVVGRCKPHP